LLCYFIGFVIPTKEKSKSWYLLSCF
jgi:hypothetical protein